MLQFIISATSSSAKNGDGNQHIFASVFVCFCFPYDWRDFLAYLINFLMHYILMNELLTKSEHFIISYASCSVVSSNQKDKARTHDQLESYFIHR